MSSTVAKTRPKHLNLIVIRLPVAGIVSIMHRVSGAVLFLMLPLLLWLFQSSIQSPETFARFQGCVSNPLAKLFLLALLWGYLHHLLAGVRHLFLDLHVGAELDSAEGWQIYVPAGFLHGFVTREPDTIVQYKVSDVYAPDCDGGVLWNDPDLAIDWGIDADQAQLSAKDAVAQRFADFKSPF